MLRVAVTGGGTIAPMDDVRHIANASTGRLSSLITEACLSRGASVWHIHSAAAELPFDREARFLLDSNDEEAEFERLRALKKRWLAARDRLHLVPLRTGRVEEYAGTLHDVLVSHSIDVVFLAMAVSDYECEATPGKLVSSDEPLTLRLQPTPKVIRAVRDWVPGIFLVGFKLLSGVSDSTLISEARRANQINRADLTVANDLRTIRAGRHTIHLVRDEEPVETMAGRDMADRLVERVFTWATESSLPRHPTDTASEAPNARQPASPAD